jgi:hypothetical protein
MEICQELEKRIADLRARMPKHSVPPAMLVELEDLEEALAHAQEAAGTGGASPPWVQEEASGG